METSWFVGIREEELIKFVEEQLRTSEYSVAGPSKLIQTNLTEPDVQPFINL